MESLVYIALFAPFVGSLFAGLFFARSPKNIIVGIVNPALIFIAFLASVVLAFHVAEYGEIHVKMMDWISVGNLKYSFWIYS